MCPARYSRPFLSRCEAPAAANAHTDDADGDGGGGGRGDGGGVADDDDDTFLSALSRFATMERLRSDLRYQ